MMIRELFWMMEFQHWPWAIKFCLNKMTGVLGKIIKVFEDAKNFKKYEKRRGSGVLGGAVVVKKHFTSTEGKCR